MYLEIIREFLENNEKHTVEFPNKQLSKKEFYKYIGELNSSFLEKYTSILPKLLVFTNKKKLEMLNKMILIYMSFLFENMKVNEIREFLEIENTIRDPLQNKIIMNDNQLYEIFNN